MVIEKYFSEIRGTQDVGYGPRMARKIRQSVYNDHWAIANADSFALAAVVSTVYSIFPIQRILTNFLF